MTEYVLTLQKIVSIFVCAKGSAPENGNNFFQK
jgi:hypothetical protein